MPTSHSRRGGTSRTQSRTRLNRSGSKRADDAQRAPSTPTGAPEDENIGPAVGTSAQPEMGTATDLTEPHTWMSYEQVCVLLGESRHTLNKWRRRPELNFPPALRKPNNHLMFRRSDVAAFISNLEVAR